MNISNQNITCYSTSFKAKILMPDTGLRAYNLYSNEAEKVALKQGRKLIKVLPDNLTIILRRGMTDNNKTILSVFDSTAKKFEFAQECAIKSVSDFLDMVEGCLRQMYPNPSKGVLKKLLK